MDKKFLLAWLVAFIVWFFGSFAVHGVLLHDDYSKLTNLFRTPEQSQPLFAFMLLAHVLMSGAFVWIYARGVEAKPWLAQGVRFGMAVAVLTSIPMYMIYYVVQPMPGDVVVKQMVFDSIVNVVVGIAVAFMYRTK
jgi:hypothetical protein